MTDSDMAKVVLLPKTVDYYQIQLTRMLETERYIEAMELLQFLLGCQPNDVRLLDEWQALLLWLESQFTPIDGEEEEDVSEADLLEQHVQLRSEQDLIYGEKLLGMLFQPDSIERQLLALDQLTYIDNPGFDQTIKDWLEMEPRHPLVQFKGLQTLKKRQFDGEVKVLRWNEPTIIHIDEVPLQLEQYPMSAQVPLQQVQEVCEIVSPSLAYFAEQIWQEFLGMIFGTSMYDSIISASDDELRIWAAALHYSALSLMNDASPNPEQLELLEHYGLREHEWSNWKEKCIAISMKQQN